MARRVLVALLALLGAAAGQDVVPVENIAGVVSGAGFYAGCTAKMQLPSGITVDTRTLTDGSFAVQCTYPGGDTCVGTTLRLAGGWNGPGCTDSTTGLPLVFGLEAALPQEVLADGKLVGVNAITTLQSVLFQATNGGEWGQLTALVAQQLGLPSAETLLPAFQGNLIQGARAGDPASLRVLAAVAKLQNVVIVGANLLAGMMVDGTTLTNDDVSTIIYYTLGLEMAKAARTGDSFNLTDPTAIATALASAKDSLAQVADLRAGSGSVVTTQPARKSRSMLEGVWEVGNATLAEEDDGSLSALSLEELDGSNATFAGEGPHGDSDDEEWALSDEGVSAASLGGLGFVNATSIEEMDPEDEWASNTTIAEEPVQLPGQEPAGHTSETDEDGTEWQRADGGGIPEGGVAASSIPPANSTAEEEDPWDDWDASNSTDADANSTVVVGRSAPAPESDELDDSWVDRGNGVFVYSPTVEDQPPAQPPAAQPSESQPQQPATDGQDVIVWDRPDLATFGQAGVVAQPVALLNEFTEAALDEGLQPEAIGNATIAASVVRVLQRIMAVAQMDIAPSARQLGSGFLDAGEFQAFDADNLVKLIQSVPLAGEDSA